MSTENQNEMSFLDHLEELRWHLVRSAIAIVVASIAAFVLKEFVFDVVVMGPSQDWFFTNRFLCGLSKELLCINTEPIRLQSILMAGQFMAHIKISLITGLIIAFPYVSFEIWRFISPALYSKEKKHARGGVFAVSFLFFLGVLFGYFVICPLSINFLYSYQVTDQAENIIKLMSYVSLIAGISLASGIMFELPVVVFFLTKIGLLTPQVLKKYRKHSLIGILILSAIITPPDIFSQILVSFPLLFLYEISIGISRRIVKKQEG